MTLWRLLTSPFRRGPRQPLAHMRPEPAPQREIPLGMEAIDMDMVEKVSRQNDALERTNRIASGQRGGMTGHWSRQSATHVEPMPEDETYAARYHRAYNRKDPES